MNLTRLACSLIVMAVFTSSCGPLPAPETSSPPELAAEATGATASNEPPAATPTRAPRPTATPADPLPLIEVTGVGDLVNGNRESVEKFIADPGEDGMGLREALELANRASGATTIKFSPDMAGQTIHLGSDLDVIRDQITIEGLTDADGKPAVTIVAAQAGRGGIRVTASHVTIRGLRITGLDGRGVRAGVYLESTPGVDITDILIENNILEGTGDNSSDGISMKTAAELGDNSAVVRDVIIRGNTLTDFMADCDGIHIGSNGANSLIDNILVTGNTFLRSRYPIELEEAGTDNRIQNVRILNNYFAENEQPISIGPIGEPGEKMSGNVTADTVIEGNVFENNRDSTVVIVGGYLAADAARASLNGNTVQNTRFVNNIVRANQQGFVIYGGSDQANNNLVTDTLIEGNLFEGVRGNAVSLTGGKHAGGNVVRNTKILNNVMANEEMGGVRICAGNDGSNGNEIQDTEIANNTIASHPVNDRYVFGIQICSDGDPGNLVSGLKTFNNILWGNNQDFDGMNPDMVSFSITRQQEFTGVNGNVGSDPQFLNWIGGDYHLTADSPAVDAGSPDGAPEKDIECSHRVGLPDIGAYEFDETETRCEPISSG